MLLSTVIKSGGELSNRDEKEREHREEIPSILAELMKIENKNVNESHY